MIQVTSQAMQQLQNLIGFESIISDLTFQISDHSPSHIKKFRLGVIGGGCSGFQYKFSIEAKSGEKDLLFKNPQSQLEILVNEEALDFIKGSTLNYLIDLGKKHFTVNNPNASSKCGCGSSFNL
jgi:iron-sulfur cluster insertion protein